MGIYRFTPGTCRKECRCTRCGATAAPRYWTATIQGQDYRLYPARQNNLQHCVYEQYLEGAIDCDDATHVVLNLGETISDYFWDLFVVRGDGTKTHNWLLGGLSSIDCQSSYELPKIGGSCGGGDAATLTPGPPAGGRCCQCEESTGSGSSVGPGLPPDDGCCLEVPPAWDIEIPAPLWSNLSCGACEGVSGVFHCPFVEWSPLGGARYRYTNLHWCADTAAPCVGGDAGLFLLVVFQGCSLWVSIVLERLLLDHEICAASCRARYRGDHWRDTKPIDCTTPSPPLVLTQENYLRGNSCSGRTFGTPGGPSFDTLCEDFGVGHPGPETIAATAG